MSKAIAFHLQKGGVGKTTVSGTLACQSALNGLKTLLIDCDPQGNLSSWFFATVRQRNILQSSNLFVNNIYDNLSSS